MASKKKLKKGIATLEKRLEEHKQKFLSATNQDYRGYLIKDMNRIRKYKEKKEKRLYH